MGEYYYNYGYLIGTDIKLVNNIGCFFPFLFLTYADRREVRGWGRGEQPRSVSAPRLPQHRAGGCWSRVPGEDTALHAAERPASHRRATVCRGMRALLSHLSSNKANEELEPLTSTARITKKSIHVVKVSNWSFSCSLHFLVHCKRCSQLRICSSKAFKVFAVSFYFVFEHTIFASAPPSSSHPENPASTQNRTTAWVGRDLNDHPVCCLLLDTL